MTPASDTVPELAPISIGGITAYIQELLEQDGSYAKFGLLEKFLAPITTAKDYFLPSQIPKTKPRLVVLLGMVS